MSGNDRRVGQSLPRPVTKGHEMEGRAGGGGGGRDLSRGAESPRETTWWGCLPGVDPFASLE